MIVGTAGHVDHGKTSLVKALTGVDTDRLKEEKARGISIELGFAYSRQERGGTIGFVDVPGHERFVHTMIAGASGIDHAMLVVAADDGVMPQTREHLEILEHLAIDSGVVALTKIDLVEAEWLDVVEDDLREVLAGGPLAAAPILRVSARTGFGLDDLWAALRRLGPRYRVDRQDVALRFAVDRSFSIAGAGLVVSGVAVSGSASVGDEVVILPAGTSARIRGMQYGGLPVQEVLPGERRAINLSGREVHPDSVRRGYWLAGTAAPHVSDRFDGELRLSGSARRPLRARTQALLHHGAAQYPVHVVLLDRDRLDPGDKGLAQIVLDRAGPFRNGDRFVLRDVGARSTLGGGVVLDPRAPARRRRQPHRIATLDAHRHRDPTAALTALVAIDGSLVDLDAFAADREISSAEARGLAPKNCRSVWVEDTGGTFVMSRASHASFRESLLELVAHHHAARPFQDGIPHGRLVAAARHVCPPSVAEALLAELVVDGVLVMAAGRVASASRTGQLSPEDERSRIVVLEALARQPLSPLIINDLCRMIDRAPLPVRQLLKSLARKGDVVEVAPDYFFLAEAVEHLREHVEALSEQSSGAFSAAQFRDRIGGGRTLAIKILEYFDRKGITVRKGETRAASGRSAGAGMRRAT